MILKGSREAWSPSARKPKGLTPWKGGNHTASPSFLQSRSPSWRAHGLTAVSFKYSIHGPVMESRPGYLYLQMVQTLVEQQMCQMLLGQRKISELGR